MEIVVTHYNLRRVAHMEKIFGSLTLGGASLGVPLTLQKRGPLPLPTGRRGRLPPWTAVIHRPCTFLVTALGYKNFTDAHQPPRVCPAARRAVAMVRIGMAMAQAATATAAEPEAEVNITEAVPLSTCTTLALTFGPTFPWLPTDSTGIVGIIGSFTPLHTMVRETATALYTMVVSRLTAAPSGLGVSRPSAPATTSRGAKATGMDDIAFNLDSTKDTIATYTYLTQTIAMDGTVNTPSEEATATGRSLALTSPTPPRRGRA